MELMKKFFGFEFFLLLKPNDELALSDYSLLNIMMAIARKDHEWFESLGLSKGIFDLFVHYPLNLDTLVDKLVRTECYNVEYATQFKRTIADCVVNQDLRAELVETIARQVKIQIDDKLAKMVQSAVQRYQQEAENEQDIYLGRMRNKLYQIQEYFLQSIPKASLSKANIDYTTQQAALKPVKENDEQHPIFMRIINRLQHQTKRKDDSDPIREIELVNGVLINYPTKATLDTLKPDVVLLEDINDMKGPYIKTVVELTLLEPIDQLHLGKGISYNEMILKQQPERQFVISMITNLKQVVFVKSFKPAKNESVSTGFMTTALDFIDSIGIIWTLLNGDGTDYTGFTPLVVDLRSLAVKTLRFIGAGATSHCYQSTTHPDLVIKKFYSREFFDIERQIYEHIKLKRKERPTSRLTHLMALVDQDMDNMVLVFQGLGRRIVKEEYRSKRVLLSMLSCLKELNELSIVHRDITRRHFLIREGSDSQVMLVDLGCATIRNGEETYYRGTAYLAANEVLQSVADRKLYVPEFRHDWESFVKLLMIQTGYVTYSSLRALNNTEPRHFKHIVDYWTNLEVRLCCSDPTNPFLHLLKSCRKPDMKLDLLQSDFKHLFESLNQVMAISAPLEHVRAASVPVKIG